MAEDFAIRLGKAIDQLPDWSTRMVRIYVLDANRLPHGDRTGVLLAIGDKHFVVTAAHELKKYAKHELPLIVPYPKEGRGAYVQLGHPILKEREDIALFELTPGHAGELSTVYQFVRIHQVATAPPPHLGSLYAVIGFPCDDKFQEIDHEKRFLSHRAAMIGASAYMGEVDSLQGYDSKLHLLIRHNIENLSQGNQIVESPQIYGMSGGAVLHIPESLLGGNDVQRTPVETLCGIQIANLEGRYMKAVRIEFVIDLIGKRYPELATVLSIQW